MGYPALLRVVVVCPMMTGAMRWMMHRSEGTPA